jgi:hypothetical protein
MKVRRESLATLMGGQHRFRSSWLLWVVERPTNAFRVHVVEPRASEPPRHAAIFWGALRAFIPKPREAYALDSDRVGTRASLTDRFDLLSFPEAFLPAATLEAALLLLGARGAPFGCVHAGLRPTDDETSTHLFEGTELRALLERLRGVDNLEVADLEAFGAWLAEQLPTDRFNVACLFTVDAEGKVRICLHAKFVRSKFEVNAARERHMKEANLLSLVTLRSTVPEFSSVTIQPLICADVLPLHTEEPNNHPIPAVSTHRSCFSQLHADEIDVVSVVTWTPNKERANGAIEWHHQFRDAFRSAAAGEQSHHHRYAAFVLSNFRFTKSPSADSGGLSGIFVPLPLFNSPYDARVSTARCIYGHFPSLGQGDEGGEDDRWVGMDTYWPKREKQFTLGYIVALDPRTHRHGSAATMFGFTMSHLPRDANRWARTGSVANFSLLHALAGGDGSINFRHSEGT